MALNTQAIERNSDCNGDNASCKPRNYHAEVVEERDEKSVVEIECGSCGAAGTLVISTAFGSHGDLLAAEGDFDSEGR